MSQLEKLDEFIKENDVKKFKYHTWRQLDNDGEIRILVWKEDGPARTEYVCPECGHHGYAETEWKRPYRIRCDECDKSISVPKLKNKFKREKKKKIEKEREQARKEMDEESDE